MLPIAQALNTGGMTWNGIAQTLLSDSAPARQEEAAANAHDVTSQSRQAQFKSMNDVLPLVMLVSALSSVGLYIVLKQLVPSSNLDVWLLGRLLINLTRGLFSFLCNKRIFRPTERNFKIYAALALMDGIAWGAVGWWITPVDRLDVAIITLPMGVIVACIGVLGLHVHVPSGLAFLLPMTLPSALHALGRGDQLGLICSAAMLGLTLMLVFELMRFNRRFLETLRLRFESEQTAKAKTEALRQAHELARTRSRFVATMSHEVRTPLHGMLGMLQLVHKADSLDDARRHLSLMQSTGDHLVKVINEVLDHARMGATGLPVSAQPFNLAGVVAELAEFAAHACKEKGLRFELQSAIDPDEMVKGDSTRIRQVLHNLLGNALKFTSEGGLTLTAGRDPQSGLVRMGVRDTGVGIPQDEQERIFEPYHQVEGTYERQFGGTGLGLTISRELCAAMGGALTCASELGRGSEFVCMLPLPHVASEAVAPFTGAQATGPETRGPSQGDAPEVLPCCLDKRVLLVEDNPVNTLVAEAALKKLGLHVTALDGGESALKWLRSNRADLVLMDCEMPGLDGIQTTRRIRVQERMAGHPPVPIVAMTANGLDTYEERCVPAGMNDYLSKPFGQEALRDVILRQMSPASTMEPVAALD